MITPILKDPKSNGGTLYTFPSASRDLTRVFSNSEYEFAFSHFACLNLPDLRYGEFKDGDLKGIYLDHLHKGTIDDSAKNLNKSLKWHIQSYVMNYEVAILNGFSLDESRYDNDILRTPSERIFFNWLQKVGAIKFNDSNTETVDGYGNDIDSEIGYETLTSESELETVEKSPTKFYRIGNKLYSWRGGEWKSRVFVSKTVQYIGNIEMINNVNIDYDSFNEIYLNIPAGVGGSTDVWFDNEFDKNYQKGQIIDIDKDQYCDNPDYIIGRIPEELGMLDDVTLNAIYDDIDSSSDPESKHEYKIENGYCINFSDNKYVGGIDGMNFNSEEDFEFNCVLIYYRIRKGNGNWYTNLYGVLFLEEVIISDINTGLNDDDERAGYIQRYPKFKKGNSWGLKLDLKIDAQPDSQLELRDIEYDDPNNGVDMQMFSEALVKLNECTNIFYEVKKENTDIEERLYKLENMVSGIDTVYDLRDKVNELRTRVEIFQPSLDSLQGRIESAETRITKLENYIGYLISDIKNLKNSLNQK
jgi:hypothetical protein